MIVHLLLDCGTYDSNNYVILTSDLLAYKRYLILH